MVVVPKKNGDLTAGERRKHIEEEASFKATVLGEFKFAREQRTTDKKDFTDRFNRMEKKHTETYTNVFEKIELNGKAIIANQTNIDAIKDDVKDDIKKDIDKLETDVKKVGRKSGVTSGAATSLGLKVVEKVLQSLGIG